MQSIVNSGAEMLLIEVHKGLVYPQPFKKRVIGLWLIGLNCELRGYKIRIRTER